MTDVRWRQAVDGIAAADSELRVNLDRATGGCSTWSGRRRTACAPDTAPPWTAGAAPCGAGRAGSSGRCPRAAARRARPAPRVRRRQDRRAGARQWPARLARDLQGRTRARSTTRSSTRAPGASGARQPGQERDAGQRLGALPERTAGRLRGAARSSRLSAGWRSAPTSSAARTRWPTRTSTTTSRRAAGEWWARSDRRQLGFAPARRRVPGAQAVHVELAGRPTAGRRTATRAVWPSTSPTASTTTSRRTRSASTPRRAASTRASTRSWSRPTTGAPGDGLRNNATMFTPPDGRSPRNGLRLVRAERLPRRSTRPTTERSSTTSTRTGSRAGSSTTPAARRALNSAKAGAIGEGWSDCYAKDCLVGQFSAARYGTAGEIEIGGYTDNNAPHDPCPGNGLPGRGPGRVLPGGRQGRIGRVHLRRLRQGLRGARRCTPTVRSGPRHCGICASRSASPDARRLITKGMRLSPPEPTFLDMRDAILLADQARGAAPAVTQIWGVFAERGMGCFATWRRPVQDISTPPGRAPRAGRSRGRMTDTATGTRSRARGRHRRAGQRAGQRVGTSRGDGAYSRRRPSARGTRASSSVPPGYNRVMRAVAVPSAGQSASTSPLRRNWAAVLGRGAGDPGTRRRRIRRPGLRAGRGGGPAGSRPRGRRWARRPASRWWWRCRRPST